MERDEMLRQLAAEYRRKAERSLLIAEELEREAGQPASDETASALTIATGTALPAPSGTPQFGAWHFMGKSQTDSVKMLLTIYRHPLTTEDIMEGLKRGGAETRADKYNFYSALMKMDGIVRVKRNTWALQEWGIKPPPKIAKPKPRPKPRAAKRNSKSKAKPPAPTEGGAPA